MATGKIKFYDSAKGYGFIVPDGGGEDAFFHVSQTRAIPENLIAGLPVQFELGTSPRSGRLMAIALRLAHG